MDKNSFWLEYIESMNTSDINKLWKKADLISHMLTKEYRHMAVPLYREYLNQDKVSLSGIKEDLDLDENNFNKVMSGDLKKYAIKYHLFKVCRKLARLYSDYYYNEDALLYINKAIELFPYYHGGYKDKVEYLSKLGRLEEAILCLEKINSEEFKTNFPKWVGKIIFTSHTSTFTGNEYFKRYNYKEFNKKTKNLLQIYKDKLERNYVYKPRGNKNNIELDSYSEIKLNEECDVYVI